MKKQLRFLLATCLALLLAADLQAQCGDCGTGSEGAFNAIANTTIAGGPHNFTTFAIAPGITVRVTGTQPLEIMATGAVSIEGTLDASGLAGANGVTYTSGGAGALGVAGGGDGGAGSFSSPNGPINGVAGTGPGNGGMAMGWSGGGGAGYSAVGGSSGGVGGIGGPIYGDPQLTGMTSGSGGGGGSGGYDCGAGGGGAGGGYISIKSCVSITINGNIHVDGGSGGSDGTGNCGGGGGGSGGSIYLGSIAVTLNGALTALGGAGGASTIGGNPYYGVGGAGSVGRIRIDAGTYSGAGTANPPTGFAGTFNAGVTIDTISATNASCYADLDGSATATAIGGTGQLSYAWSNGAVGTTITGLGAGCYEVTVSDSLGCTDVDTICLTEPQPITVGMTLDGVTCFGTCDGIATVFPGGGTPPLSIVWGNGDTTQSITNLCPGFIGVTITDANNCVFVAPGGNVTQPNQILLSETHTDASFGMNNGTATVTATGGTPGYTYLWTPGGQTTASVANLAPGTYTCVVTDTNGCDDTISVVISMLIGTSTPRSVLLELFPNPTQDQIMLQFRQDQLSEIAVDWFDAQGKRVLHSSHAATLMLDAAIDLSAMPRGTYLCRVTAGQQVLTRKVVVQ